MQPARRPGPTAKIEVPNDDRSSATGFLPTFSTCPALVGGVERSTSRVRVEWLRCRGTRNAGFENAPPGNRPGELQDLQAVCGTPKQEGVQALLPDTPLCYSPPMRDLTSA